MRPLPLSFPRLHPYTFRAEVDPRDMWKSTPLHRACQSGHADIVELLLRRGASTSAKDDIKHRPGQSFDNDVSSEKRQVRVGLAPCFFFCLGRDVRGLRRCVYLGLVLCMRG